MATRRQPLIPGWLIPGVSATTLVVAVALAAFLALWWNAPQDDWVAVWQDSYLWHVVRFSFWQAFLSALLSVIPAIFLARALYRRRFPGRLALLRLCAMTLILPVLVAVFGILSVYGRQGWLATLCQSLGLEWTFSPYGLQGILLAHVFFNLPMASRLLLQALENIPGEQRQLAAQLGMRSWHFFRFVEWPWLRRQIPPVAALIFMLCFASFATVLSLGGGPQATTIELAIYQALSYDYDPARAAMLAPAPAMVPPVARMMTLGLPAASCAWAVGRASSSATCLPLACRLMTRAARGWKDSSLSANGARWAASR